MKIILKKHSVDEDMVEMYAKQTPRDYLMAVCHKDCFEGLICDRLDYGGTVTLNAEISCAEPSRILDIFVQNGFDKLSEPQQKEAIEHIERCISDLAESEWDYDDMLEEI